MTPIIELDGVGYQQQAHIILQDVNLRVGTGAYLTVVGPSGSGKSTLLRLIATLLTPTRGQIIYQSRDQADYSPVDYRREVSYCFQQAQLFAETVRDNLTFPFLIRHQNFDAQRALTWLQRFHLPADMLDAPITKLSGGEKQRVGLIRNMMFTPKVMLLDEVTAGLDADTKGLVHQVLRALNREDHVTMIAVTHDETEIAAAHNVVTVDNHTLEAHA